MKEENLTYQDIRELSTNYLRSILKEDIKDILLSDYPIEKKELFLNEILDEYLFLINDIRKDELEDIIVNQFESI